MSELGSQVSVLALPLIAVRSLQAGAFQVGVLNAMQAAAFLLIGLPAGAWVDRLRRRPVMLTAEMGRLAVLASVPIAWAFGALSLAQLYAVAFITGALTVFFDVAYQSYLPFLVGVDNLVEGNAKLAATAQVAQVAGPSIAGILVQAVGGPLAVGVDAASYALSAAGVAAVRAREPAPADAKAGATLVSQMKEGLHFVLRHPILRAIAASTGTFNLFSSMSSAVSVLFLVRVVHLSPGLIGFLFAAGGVGGVLGAIAARPLAARLGGARSVFLGIALTAGGLLAPLTGPGARAALFGASAFLVALGVVIYNINQLSFRQRLCPPELLGRMNATMRFIVWGTLPLGSLAGGGIGTAIGARNTLWLGAAGALLSAGWLLASPLRGMRDFPPGDGAYQAPQ